LCPRASLSDESVSFPLWAITSELKALPKEGAADFDDIFNHEIPGGQMMPTSTSGRPQTASRKSWRNTWQICPAKAKFFGRSVRRYCDMGTDLQYLKETYYEGKFDFPWPDTTITAPDEPAQSPGTGDLIKTNHDATGVSEENGLG
jgi:hypothetical protein